jgi:FAD/FMN-containing dehydrogenase
VAGYEEYPQERVKTFTEDIAEIAQRIGLSVEKSAGGISARTFLQTFKKPSTEPYWKLRCKGASEDIFYLTINNKISGQITAMQESSNQAGYPVSDIGMYIQPIVQGTGVHCEFNLFYDPQQPADVERMRELSQAATRALMAKGAFFSRPYGENARLILNRDTPTTLVLKKLKNIFDPAHIMNPGKICW